MNVNFQMLPLAREFLQLVLRTNLMFFYFEGKSLCFVNKYATCEGVQKFLKLKIPCFLQDYITTYQNVQRVFAMCSSENQWINVLGILLASLMHMTLFYVIKSPSCSHFFIFVCGLLVISLYTTDNPLPFM